MSVEPRRGCGFRKVGGLYIVCEGLSAPCDRLPIALTVCPCCGGGIKQTRGWTWIQPGRLFEGKHRQCACRISCPACDPISAFGEDGRAGLLWIGEQHYPTPADFSAEAARLGVSRRIRAVPRGFKVGETWVFIAHPKAVNTTRINGDGESLFAEEPDLGPGIFAAFRPTRIERIVRQSEFDAAEADQDFNQRMSDDNARGITWVPVPDDDPDHMPTYAEVAE